MDTMYVLFWFSQQLTIILQNVNEVNRERSCLAAASSVCDLAKHNGLVTVIARLAAASSVCDSTKHNGLVTPFQHFPNRTAVCSKPDESQSTDGDDSSGRESGNFGTDRHNLDSKSKRQRRQKIALHPHQRPGSSGKGCAG